jgi:hypothetical protein
MNPLTGFDFSQLPANITEMPMFAQAAQLFQSDQIQELLQGRDLTSLLDNIHPDLISKLDLSSVRTLIADKAISHKFCQILLELLEALSISFPECKTTQQWAQKIKQEVLGHPEVEHCVIETWHNTAFTYFSLADAHDRNFLLQKIYIFADLNWPQKIQDQEFMKDSESCLWDYCDLLIEQSRIYNAIPQSMLKDVQSGLLGLLDKLKTGQVKLDYDTLSNSESLLELGRTVLDVVNPGDMSYFQQNLKGLVSHIDARKPEEIVKFIAKIPAVNEMLHKNGWTSDRVLDLVQDAARSQSEGLSPQEILIQMSSKFINPQ